MPSRHETRRNKRTQRGRDENNFRMNATKTQKKNLPKLPHRALDFSCINFSSARLTRNEKFCIINKTKIVWLKLRLSAESLQNFFCLRREAEKHFNRRRLALLLFWLRKAGNLFCFPSWRERKAKKSPHGRWSPDENSKISQLTSSVSWFWVAVKSSRNYLGESEEIESRWTEGFWGLLLELPHNWWVESPKLSPKICLTSINSPLDPLRKFSARPSTSC